MSRLVNWMAFLAVMFLISQPLSAQEPQRGGGGGGALIGRVQQELDELKLTDEQKARVDPILEKARSDFRAMAEQLIQDEPQARREKLRDFVVGVRDQIKPILTPEQARQFEERLKAMQSGGGGRGAAGAGGAGAGRPGAMLERLRNRIEELDLTEEQRTQARQVLQETRQKMQELRNQAQGDMQAMRDQAAPILQETRQRLMQILTPEQQQKLSEMMSEGQGPRPEFAKPEEKMAPEPPAMMSAPKPSPDAPPVSTPPAEVPAAENLPLLSVGQAAPDFTLKAIDNQTIQLSNLKGRLVLVVFGSYSSPSFRQRAAALERIKRDYGTRVHPVVVYTRENHAVGEWEVSRNKDEGVAVEQPADMDARVAMARQAKDALKLSVPIAVDGMDDATAHAFGGTTNAAFLIGRDGTVVARQKWFEPYAMRRSIDEALGASRAGG